MDNNTEKTSNEQYNKKTKVLIAVIAGALIVAGATIAIVSSMNSEDTTAPIKTEIATDADGTPTVVQGTTPNGTLIENGTYPDGTQVEFATTASGEFATEVDGTYIINYIETATVAQNAENSASNSDNQDNNKNNNSSSKNNTGSQGSSSNNSSSSSDKTSSSNGDKGSPSSNSNNAGNSSSSASSGNSSSKPSDNSSSSSSSSSNSSSSGSTSNSSSNTNTTPSTDGDSKATINGSSYNVGDKIKVSYYLQSSVKFCGIQCDVNYDSEILKIDSSSVDIPNLAGAMSNPDAENKVKFLSSAASAVNDFKEEKLLFSCEFEVLKASSSDVTINIIDILDNDVLSIPSENYTVTAKVEKL